MSQNARVQQPYKRVTLYFVFVGLLVCFALYFLLAFANAMAGMSPAGSNNHDFRNMLWWVGTYCLVGAIAGYFGRPRNRLFLTLFAHCTIFVGAMLLSDSFSEGAKTGIFLCGLLAIPFGVPWLILVADAIWKNSHVNR